MPMLSGAKLVLDEYRDGRRPCMLIPLHPLRSALGLSVPGNATLVNTIKGKHTRCYNWVRSLKP